MFCVDSWYHHKSEKVAKPVSPENGEISLLPFLPQVLSAPWPIEGRGTRAVMNSKNPWAFRAFFLGGPERGETIGGKQISLFAQTMTAENETMTKKASSDRFFPLETKKQQRKIPAEKHPWG